jgi:hypothetical protein
MRNFLQHSPFRKKNNRSRAAGNSHKNEFIEILDTDEDTVMNQYNVYLNYINTIKKELLRGSEAFMGYKRNIATQ